jgi:hypothetical protein
MTFSLRDLLALVFLAALGLLAWRSGDDARREKLRLAQLQDKIKALEAEVRWDQPALHQAILHTHEEFQPLGAMRERSLAHFDVLREKYSVMEPREANVLSLRGVPSLPPDSGSAPVLYRLLVPPERDVWLKFAVHVAEKSGQQSKTLDEARDLLSESSLGASGPFEVPLPPGEHWLRIVTGPAREGALPVLISLDETVLLRKSFISADVRGTSSSYTSALTQFDVHPRDDLPRLLTAKMGLEQGSTEPAYAFSVWLSDRTSNFARFPSPTTATNRLPTDAPR